MAELHLLRDEEVVYVRPVGAAPLYIGRAATNDLVLTDPKVSSRHAVVWASQGELRVEDLGSRNGTLVNGERIAGQILLRVGDKLQIGNTVLGVAQGPRVDGDACALAIEDRTAGIRYPLRTDRFRIGSDPASDLLLDGDARAATLVIHAGGEVWLGTDDDERELATGEPFVVAGHELVLIELTDDGTRTEGLESTRYDYRLEVGLNWPSGPAAVLTERSTGRSHRVDTEHRATLLYLLGRQHLRDTTPSREQRGEPPWTTHPSSETDQGWCADDDIATGVWGQDKARNERNNFHVLVCRLRKGIADAGFDGWFIEKKRKCIRARLAEVVLRD